MCWFKDKQKFKDSAWNLFEETVKQSKETNKTGEEHTFKRLTPTQKKNFFNLKETKDLHKQTEEFRQIVFHILEEIIGAVFVF